MSEEIENRIRALLQIKTTSQALSNALFGYGGLFGRLAKTEQERKALMNTPLFREAEERIMEIERAEIAAERRRIEETCPPAKVSGATLNGIAGPSNSASPQTPGMSEQTA